MRALLKVWSWAIGVIGNAMEGLFERGAGGWNTKRVAQHEDRQGILQRSCPDALLIALREPRNDEGWT